MKWTKEWLMQSKVMSPDNWLNLLAVVFIPILVELSLKIMNLVCLLVQVIWFKTVTNSKLGVLRLRVLCNWSDDQYSIIWVGVHFLWSSWIFTKEMTSLAAHGCSSVVYYNQLLVAFHTMISYLETKNAKGFLEACLETLVYTILPIMQPVLNRSF